MIAMAKGGSPSERAERLQRGRALACLVVAATILTLLIASFGSSAADFLRGMSVGVTAAATLYLPPIYRWLRPNDTIARLFDDESTREHRRMASTSGMVAGVAAAIALSFVTADHSPISAFDTARVIAAAAMVAALTSFAILELRAQRTGADG